MLAALEFLYHIIVNKEISNNVELGMDDLLKTLAKKARKLSEHSLRAKDKIMKYSSRIWREDLTILIHGYSSTIFALLKNAREMGFKVNVFVTEARPLNEGEMMKEKLEAIHIPTSLILDASVGSIMPKIDYVFLGAEAVVENGGIINKIGSLTIALCAKSHKKRVYVFTESLKFIKKYPLNQKDISSLIPKMDSHENLMADYTPPEYITSLITDLGISPPSVVADELIQFF